MKYLILIFCLFSSTVAFCQYDSYAESYIQIKMGADIVLTTEDASFFIIAKEDYTITTFLTKNVDKRKSLESKALEEIDCSACEIIELKESRTPIKEILDKMEEGEVYRVLKKARTFEYALYGEKEN